MLTRTESELLCQVGAGTPMGNLLREYWMPPALRAQALQSDDAPVRVRLLSENYIAFRACWPCASQPRPTGGISTRSIRRPTRRLRLGGTALVGAIPQTRAQANPGLLS